MKNKIHWLSLFLCVVSVLLSYNSAFASIKGKEFWYAHVDVSLYTTAGTTRCYLYIHADHATTIRVEAPTPGWDTMVTAGPGLNTIILPRTAINTGWLVNRGYGVHITAEDSISIISHIGNRLIDENGPPHKEASLILPVSALGYEYYLASSKVKQLASEHSATSQLVVVATEDNTVVEIVPTDTTLPEYPVGKPFTVSLNRGEMFGLRSDPSLKNNINDTTADLTGSHIRASAPIAVFGGTFGEAYVLESNSRESLDYDFEQMLPVSVLGREYILAPVLGTPEPYLCRIFAMYDNTSVSVNGGTPKLLHKGEKYDFETLEALYIQSDQPISVYQYIQEMTEAIYDSLNFSAHAFTAIQPLEQMSIQQTVFPDVPFNLPIRQTFVNIIMKTTDLSSLIELDGTPINNEFIPVPARPEYSYARLRIPQGLKEHRLSALKPFIGYVYGSGQNPPNEGRASPVYFHGLGGAGSNLLLSAKADADTVCPDSIVNFTGQLSMSLDTAGAVWLWDFGDGNSAVGERVQHSYGNSGTYAVTLTIRKGNFLLTDPVRLTVAVAAPVVNSSNLIDFGVVSPCLDNGDQNVTLRNIGTRTADIQNANWTTGSGLFTVVSPTIPMELGVDKEALLQLRFNSPGIAGVWRDTLRMQVEPCGSVVEIAVVAEVLPGSVAAQPLHVGVVSGCTAIVKDTAMTIANTGEREITLTGAVVPAGYSVLNLSTPVVLPAHQSYDLDVRFSPTTPGVYNGLIRIAYQYAECRDTISVPLTGELQGVPIAVESGGDTTLCAGQQSQLWAGGGTSYKWEPTEGLDNPSSSTPVASPLKTTVYTVIVTNESGCTGSSVVVVSIRDLPVLNIEGAGSICPGGSTQLAATGAESYRWTPAEGLDDPTSATPVASPAQRTTYTVTGTAKGCSATASITVDVWPLPEISISNDTTVCAGESVPLIAQSAGTAKYEWIPAEGLDDPASAQPVATPTKTTRYRVVVESEYGCRDSAEVMIIVRQPSAIGLHIPDIVVPGQRFSIPVLLSTPQDIVPLGPVHLRLVLQYPSQMMRVEQVAGALLRENRWESDGIYHLEIEIGAVDIRQAEQQLAEIRCQALLTAQQWGEVRIVSVDVVDGDCITINGKGGTLQMDLYCQSHDLHRFTPLSVYITPQPPDEQAQVYVRTSVAGSYRGQLYDSFGRLVWEQQWEQQSDHPYQGDIHTATLSTGMYFLRVEGSGQTIHVPVVITR